MPIPIPSSDEEYDLLPTLTRRQIDAARTSSWYDTFQDITFDSTVIDLSELGEEEEFLHWLESDSIFLPEGSEGRYAPDSSTSPTRRRSSSNASSSSSSSDAPVYHLPKLNAAIRQVIEKYNGSVFPKLNWTAPKDAAFILPQTSSGPLHCTSPSDVYLLLKSSDFISHDLDPSKAYLDCSYDEQGDGSAHESGRRPKLELVLRRFQDINPSREVRCFVRNNTLIGITQRDNVFYDHLQNEDTRIKICDTVRAFWEDEIRENYTDGEAIDYIFDLYLSPNFDSAQIIDFQPYRSSVDPLLFTYEELLSILNSSSQPPQGSENASRSRLPIFKIIDSKAHPSVSRNAPTYQSNMMPLEMIELSQGRNMQEFKDAWDEAVAQGMTE
ncbi:cytoplasmic protein [Kwoniella mangroviensis CBS 8886]|nr:cytoplasmic protein [Kwoniella mangroviensis CBS 8886]